MAWKLRVVTGGAARCLWCERLMPLADLRHALDEVQFVCVDQQACMAEAERQEREGWPALAREA